MTDDLTHDHLRTLLAEQQARAERAETDAEVLLWNLGGCEVYALGNSLDQEPAHERARPALLAVLDLARRYRSRRKDYEDACALVARMHAIAVGEVRGPIKGVVEDVAALRSECDTALAACAEMRAALESIRDCCDPNGEIYWKIAEEALSRPDLGRGMVLVERAAFQRVRDELHEWMRGDPDYAEVLADLDALLKQGGG